MSFFRRNKSQDTASAAPTTAPTAVLERDSITGDYVVDASHSRLGFSARHAMVTTVRGQFTDFEETGTAIDPFGNTRVGFEGATTINRKDWDLSWNAALETGGVLVSEKIKLEFDVSAIKSA